MDTLLQDYKGVTEMDATSNRFKLLAYDYDLISGKVNGVSYQPGKADAFYHRYEYDAENRLTNAWTSRDSIVWERDAAYGYYKYGPMARTEFGQLRVQGLDYAYTIHGWMKGVNSTTVGDGTFDIGKDGLVSANSVVARDVLGFALHYYDDSRSEMDYKAIGGASAFARPDKSITQSLFNGNITAISMNNAGLAKGNPTTTNALPLFYNYGYDQLHRIVSMQAYKGLNTSTNVWSPVLLDDYEEAVSYDPNGNILTYVRAGAPEKSLPVAMDRLTYNYYTGTNKLHYVDDLVSSGNYTEDIDDQSSGNYTYDAIGNLITDAAEGITRIGWTVYGKIDTIEKSGDDIYYTYDASGNRITKKVGNAITVYVRDAQGNVMSVYEKTTIKPIRQTEIHLYGSSRLGILGERAKAPETITLSGGYGTAKLSIFRRGEKFFELSNHLGNVLATITDKKLQHHDGSGGVDYYTADVATANDYYPFGMGMPGRKYAANDVYRYGFNGQETSHEIHNNSFTAEYWEYDARIGRRWNVDPISSNDQSLYTCFDDNPVFYIDPDGLYRTKKEARQMRQRALEAGYDVGNVRYFKNLKEWGFSQVTADVKMGDDGNPEIIEYDILRFTKRTNFTQRTPDEENKKGGNGGSGGKPEGSPDGKGDRNFLPFLAKLNPIKSLEIYAGALVKTDLVKVRGKREEKVSTPFGGIQYKISYEAGAGFKNTFQIVTGTQSYIGFKYSDKSEMRIMYANGIGGDYNPGIRILYTLAEKPIIISGIPIPAKWKLQGDGIGNWNDGAKIGLRFQIETYPLLPNFNPKAKSGLKAEINAGFRIQFQIPEIFR